MPQTLRLTSQVAHALLAAIPEGALLVGADLRVIAVNTQLVELAGLQGVDTSPGAPVEPIAAAVAELLAPGSTALRRLTRQQFPRKAEVQFRDGRIVQSSRRPIHVDGERVGVLWLVEEITERRRSENDLRRHIHALGELARERAEFAARASHELRTPLATILSFCQLLALPASGHLTAAQHDYLGAIDRNAHRMQDMVDALLHVSAAVGAQSELSYAPVDVGPLLERLTNDALPRAEAAGVFLSLHHQPGPVALADRNQLERAVVALLDNAVKFTPSGGDVTLSAEPYEEEGMPGWQIVVSDTGIGIPKEFQEEVFTEFVRAPNARGGAFPGTGLGLSAVRDTVHLHDGSVVLHGGEGEGTTVVLRLPTGSPALSRPE
ncbi:ATP-binding protein [Streptomyces sp. NPDC041068]|uniref:sensor histidine kinase n=1 Tax=Streptomyces sp. NPDC041068 TaxID=3155130 RepID=UPI0033F6BD89